MQHTRAILFFTHELKLARANAHDPFTLVSWEDLDQLNLAMIGDQLESLSRITATDVIVYAHDTEGVENDWPSYGLIGEVRPLPPGRITASIAMGFEGAFAAGYQRVVALPETNPLIRDDLVKDAFRQMGMEDDCVVLGLIEQGGCYLLGLKFDHSRVLAQPQDQPESLDDLVKQVCSIDELVWLTKTIYGIRDGTTMQRLRLEIEAKMNVSQGFCRRTSEMFRLLHRKYKLKYPKRWR